MTLSNIWKILICIYNISGLLGLPNTRSDIIFHDMERGHHRMGRVSGGRNARINEYPYMAAVYTRASSSESSIFAFICGGVIYNREYIVTAGHCLHKKETRQSSDDVRVLVGQHQIRILLNENITRLHRVSKSFLHNGFSSEGIYFVRNDIAMLKLEQPLNYTSSIKKLRIASPKELPLDGLGDVIGWGRTEVYFASSRIPDNDVKNTAALALKSARQRIILRQYCTMRHFAIVPESILCVASEGFLNTDSACFGDSGGPLACPGPSGPYLCGLVSTGVGCGLRFTPGFYTDISKYYDWLRSIGGQQ